LDARLVHIGAVGVSDLLLVGSGRQIRAARQIVNQFLHPVVGQFAQQREGAVGGAVRRDGQLVEGGAVGVAEEAVARLHRGVAAVEVEAPGPVFRRLGSLPARSAAFGGRGLEQFEDGADVVDAGMVMTIARQGGARRQKGDSGDAYKQFLHQGFLVFSLAASGANPKAGSAGPCLKKNSSRGRGLGGGGASESAGYAPKLQ